MNVRPSTFLIWIICLSGATFIVGCFSREPQSVKSNDPSLKIPAIQADVRDHNKKDLPELVKSLDDEDPAIRFYAIEALRRLTGDNFGYHYYEDQDARKPAVDQWKQWLKKRGGT